LQEFAVGVYRISRCVDKVRCERDERGKNCISLVKAWNSKGGNESTMDLSVVQVGDVVVVVLPVDELDAGNTEEFKRDMAPVLDANKKVVLDLAKVRFVDSSGLGSFLSCLRNVNGRGGDLKLCQLAEHVRTVIELVRMHRMLDIFDTREEAVRAFGA
jgi:anti-sigma B factor antagonist